MKKIENKDKFIQMRVEGKSYQAISEILNVRKQTLIAWGKEFQTEIQNLRTIRLETIYEQYSLNKEARIKSLAEHLEKVTNELKNRDLSQVSTDKLFYIFLKLSDAQGKERENLTFSFPDVLEGLKDSFGGSWSA